ncbi:MAG: riboflavin synthase [Acidobacteriota bacterium]
MFTGLIEEVGSIAAIENLHRGVRLKVRASRTLEGLRQGDSIAVDGVCLTALGIDSGQFAAEVSPETIARTNMSYYQVDTPVNLERPLAVGQRLGGHFVQGHVDGICRAIRTVSEGEFVRVTYTLPEKLRPYLVEKGSIALNGVSLTVASLDAESFDVQLIPHTLELTNLTLSSRAETLNVEVDILGKYVARLLAGQRQEAGRDDSADSGIPVSEGFIRLPGD